MHKVVQMVTVDKAQTEKVLNERANLTQHKCYMTALKHYRRICFNWHQPEVKKTKKNQTTQKAPQTTSSTSRVTCVGGLVRRG